MAIKTTKIKAGRYTAANGRFVIERAHTYDADYPWRVTDTSGAEPFVRTSLVYLGQQPPKMCASRIALTKADCVDLIEAALEAEAKDEVAL